MPPEMRFQETRKVIEVANPKQTQASDQIQHQLNDIRAHTNVCFRELKEAIDDLVFYIDLTLQKTQLFTGESSLPKTLQYPAIRDFSAKFN
ncbi:hypothetical protein NC653_029271 [Populus alba x Populus x berolinensis]|uniref:Uncharacterized protein n=1 Tax=Populus alba x Populus x berolinensis TaxID=444605 RepID=A0AAD6M221_9ROSI|nr:hypothetical protein NC653_029271 [Populus alba x Populus x berolinensis]